jgi:hypothetical protein
VLEVFTEPDLGDIIFNEVEDGVERLSHGKWLLTE